MVGDDPDLETALRSLDFGVAKSIRYHAYRRSFWERLDRGTKITTTLSGAAVLISVIGENSPVAKIFAVIVAVAGVFDIVCGFSGKARAHDSLYKDFCLLAQKIVSTHPITDEAVRELRRNRLELEMDEPGVQDWLERRCAAEECASRGLEMHESWRLTRTQVALSQFAWWPAKIV